MLPAGAEGMPGVILPRKTVHELLRLIESSETTVGVDISASKARFTIGLDKEIGSVILTTKLIDGQFPDYARVIPKANDKVLKVNNGAFVAAVDRVSTITSERGKAVKLNLGDGKLTLSVNNPEGGSATEELEADYGAEPMEIGFNARYLLDIASQVESETAEFLLADAGSPTVVKDGSDAGSLYVLMPMRV
jgi:DNA polymerase-3 subunit beta